MTTMHFRKDGTFRVLQMADVQDGPEVNPDTIRLIREAIAHTDPDLIVFTGDQIRGYDPAYIDTFLRRRGEHPGARVRAVTKFEAWIAGITQRHQPTIAGADPRLPQFMQETRDKVRRTFAAFLGPAIDAGVPFAATYGNHDFQCGILADEQDDLYREFPGCLNPAEGDAEQYRIEPGTFAIPIRTHDNSRIAMSIMMVNSGDYADDDPDDAPVPHNTEDDSQYRAYSVNARGLDLADADGYGTPSESAISWLGDVQHQLAQANGDDQPVPSIVFQHIPPQEFYDCLREVPPWTPNAVEGARAFAGKCFTLNTAVCRPGSKLGEAIGCADVNVGQIEAMRKAGGYFALYCGHDHKNSFVGHVHDMDLGYAPTCGFTCYGPKSRLRGIRLFTFHEAAPADYDTRMITWADVVGRYSSNELRIFIADHCVTDAIGIRNELRRPTVFATVATLVGGALMGVLRGLHKLL